MTEEQKKAFDTFYNSRRTFSERHIKLAENIDHEKWLKNELFRYYEKGLQEATAWHDLRKNPQDTPKKNGEYWVYMNCSGNKISRALVWNECVFMGMYDAEILAWCELPKPPEDPE